MSKNAIGNAIGRNCSSIVDRLRVLKLKVPDNLAKRFQVEGRWKTAHILADTKPIFSTMLWTGRNGKKYWWIKTENGWKELNIWLWKAAGNEIPQGHILVFKNNDPRQCFLSNMETMSRKQIFIHNKKLKKPAVSKQVKKNKPKPVKKAKQKAVSKKDEINWSKKFLKQHVIKIPDNSNRQPVRVDHKTTIYVKPGANIENILKNYKRGA